MRGIVINSELMKKKYGDNEAKAGVQKRMPGIETWPSQYTGYEITIRIPEFTSVCPKTGLPDFGVITIQYAPKASCVELKSLKEYILAYRQLGIFYENAVNKIRDDFVAATKPEWVVITGDFTPRGGIHTSVKAQYPKTVRH